MKYVAVVCFNPKDYQFFMSENGYQVGKKTKLIVGDTVFVRVIANSTEEVVRGFRWSDYVITDAALQLGFNEKLIDLIEIEMNIDKIS